MIVHFARARRELRKLVDRATNGEEVFIARRGFVVIKLAQVKAERKPVCLEVDAPFEHGKDTY